MDPALINGPAEVVQVRDLGPTADPDDSINLQELWRALRRRRRLVAAVAGGVVALSAVVTAYQRLFKPVYEGSFQLLITDPVSTDNKSSSAADAAGAAGGGVIESLARNRTSTDLPTLIQVLTSPMVLEPVTRRVGQNPATLNLSVAPAGDRRSSAAGKSDGVLQVTLKGRSPTQLQSTLNALSQTYLQFALSQRQERLSEGLRFLSDQQPVLANQVRDLQNQLAAFRQRHSLLAPETEGAALKTELAGLELQQRQLGAERDRLLALRAGVASGRFTAESFSTGGSGGASSQGSNAGGGGIPATTVNVTQAASDRLEQLRNVEQQLAELRSTYKSDTPRVRKLSDLRNQLMLQLRQQQLTAVDNALSLNGSNSQALGRQIDGLDRQFLRQPQLIRQYEELQQQLKVAQDNLSNFLTTRESFRLEQAQNITPWKVIAGPAVAEAPVSPSVPRNLMLGVMLGLAAGAGAGLLRDRLDHVFHTPQEAREDLNQPLLGHVPHVAFFRGVREDRRFLLDELDLTISGGGADRDAQDGEGLTSYQRFYYQEAFRNLYTSLRFLNTERPLLSVALTSSVPAEGKSLVTVLLAKTLADLGQRVLLIDADLRKPQLHVRLGLDNLLGLSNLLSGDVNDTASVIQAMPGRRNWWVMPAGRRPPDPARLLSSQRMRDLVRELASSGQYDLILYDTPPALGLADAALIAEQLDGLMLLVSLNRVDRGLPREAIERLRATRVPLLGLVTNAVKEQKIPSSRSSYDSRYGYGQYGYGSYDPGTAYTYYRTDEEGAEQADTPSLKPASEGPTADLPTRIRQWRRRLITWIDS